MRGVALRPLRPGARISYPPEPEHHIRQFCVYYQPNTEHSFKVHVHNNCIHNEYVALRNRVLFDTITPDIDAIKRLKTIARAIADSLPKVSPDHLSTWIEGYKGRKRTKYQNALDSLRITPYERRDGYVMAFVKPEKIPELKDPRLIQARNARYNLLLGNYLKPIEHLLYRLKGKGRLRHILPPSRCIAKGLNMLDRARLLKNKMARFTHPVVYSLDASRFDAHVHRMTLEVEHLIYRRYYKSPQLDALLSRQIHNRGRTAHGIKYRCVGGRMSGDMNTALGNCLISLMMLASIMKGKGLKWDTLIDGDDTLLIVEQGAVLDLESEYERLGFKIKLENCTTELRKVVFCQGSPIRTSDGLKFVSIPRRVLARTCVGCKHWNSEKFRPKYLSLLGYCNLALNMGVPVLQDFSLMLLRHGRGFPTRWEPSGLAIKALREERRTEIRPMPITHEAREDFEEAFGISVMEQLVLEDVFRRANLEKRHATEEGPRTPHSAWEWYSAKDHTQAETKKVKNQFRLRALLTSQD